ncbi:hypothetical protein [Pseudoroseicyclus tamaricis]|uniref:Uncharacterized protein n=1 Tax=Pseudoroseicyclus tamaricis TaxID=2705421 RepID=A0A6B2K379_9RHOB|nr:hypothetical protein [Pseudoroseicyclus tamaricis]NDV02262.1 hypothetical protein [Pseudoroseicyclus tamaricis]
MDYFIIGMLLVIGAAVIDVQRKMRQLHILNRRRTVALLRQEIEHEQIASMIRLALEGDSARSDLADRIWRARLPTLASAIEAPEPSRQLLSGLEMPDYKEDARFWDADLPGKLREAADLA